MELLQEKHFHPCHFIHYALFVGHFSKESYKNFAFKKEIQTLDFSIPSATYLFIDGKNAQNYG